MHGVEFLGPKECNTTILEFQISFFRYHYVPFVSHYSWGQGLNQGSLHCNPPCPGGVLRVVIPLTRHMRIFSQFTGELFRRRSVWCLIVDLVVAVTEYWLPDSSILSRYIVLLSPTYFPPRAKVAKIDGRQEASFPKQP